MRIAALVQRLLLTWIDESTYTNKHKRKFNETISHSVYSTGDHSKANKLDYMDGVSMDYLKATSTINTAF